MEELKFLVYKHTNLINNKVYIGITSQIPEKRWGKNGKNYIESVKFYSAIKKYGWNNFKHEILYKGLSNKEAIDIEESLILHYQKLGKSYNLIPNVYTNLGESRKRKVIVYNIYGEYINTYESIHSAAINLKLTESNINSALKNKYGCVQIKGMIFLESEEELQRKLKLVKEKGKCYHKHILQYDLNGNLLNEYFSMKDCIQKTGYNRSTIINALCTKSYNGIALGYIWKYKCT